MNKNITVFIYYLSIIGLLIFPISVVTASDKPVENSSQSIPIIVYESVLKDYNVFLADRNPETLNDFTGKELHRDVVELILIQQALRAGGWQGKFEFLPSVSYPRTLIEIKAGRWLLSGSTVWNHDLTDTQQTIYSSSPLVKNGEFEVGIYTAHDNKQVLAAKNMEDLKQFTAVTSHTWKPDWNTLSKLNIKNVYDTPKWKSMVQMVARKRVDFLLAPFQPAEDFSFTAQDFQFAPIPNIKLGLQGSRHWIISRKHPMGEQIIPILEKGLAKLREDGLIRKAYEQSGFFNKRVENWTLINP